MNDKIIVSGVHLELTEALVSYVREKAARLLRHEPNIIRINVDLEARQNRSRSEDFEARGKLQDGRQDGFLIASASGDDLYGAIDDLVDHLDRQLQTRASQNIAKRREI